MNIWKSIAGVLEVELTSAALENAHICISEAGIEMYRMQQVNELTCCFLILRKDFRKLEKLCRSRGEKLHILKKRGMYWSMKSVLRRPVLLGGILFLFAIVLFLPTRVLFVQVEGNHNISSQRILAAAEECGICFGANRRNVRSEKVKNALLSAVPELQWAGVNTSGCVATISVRERTAAEYSNDKKEVTNIIAARDGYILSGTVTSGSAVFQIGQTVKAGQVLISGYTDCGICIRATQSEGEIIAQTNREMKVITPSTYIQRDDEQDVNRKISLLYRKKRINLWKDSGISDTSCGRMYKEYYITLPGGFQLPIALCVETYTSYALRNFDILQEDAEGGLSEFSELYLKQQMVAGEILERSQTITQENGIFCLIGDYICKEMIGREQQEQIGDTNGKNS